MPFPQPNPDFIRNKRATFYYDQIKSMYSNMLYSNLLSFSNWALSLLEAKPETFTEPQQLHVLIMCGDSAYNLTEYNRADNFYRRALQFYKSLTKISPHLKQVVMEECGHSNDLKFKIHLCLVQCSKSSEAMKMLMSIPAKQRNVQTNMALGKLFQLYGMERAAVSSYKEVLRACPTALDAVEQLIHLGSTEEDIQTLISDQISKVMPYPDWYNGWIRANSNILARDHTSGIKVLQQVLERFSLSTCSALMYSIGVANANYGDYSAAIRALTSAHNNDSSNMRGMDLLAFLLWHEGKGSDLNKLYTRLTEQDVNDSRPEPWVATAYYVQMTKRNQKALMFASKGSTHLGNKVIEGLIAKGHVHLILKQYQEAVECFREAMSINANRFEPHKGVVDCYLAMQRTRDALTVATGASKKLGCTPRILTMLAGTLKKDSTTVGKAKTYLDRALAQDPRFTPSIVSFVEILESEGKYNEAIDLLKSHVSIRINQKPDLHLKLAGLLCHTNQEESALDQYALVLKLDPTNKEAMEGQQKLDPVSAQATRQGGCPDGFIEVPHDMDVEDDEGDEGDPADSEMEASNWDDFGTNETR